MTRADSIFVAGHRGLVGSAIVRRLERAGYTNLILQGREDVDLADQRNVRRFMSTTKPDVVILAAARVGGILANTRHPAEFISSNLAIGLNVVTAAHDVGVRRLLNLGSSCIYPRGAPQPIREEALLTGPLEATNRAYAVAKIAVLELCESYNREYGTDFITLLPTNLYGPNDNFDPETSHVLPALIRRFHEAKEAGASGVGVWGTGRPKREFLHVDDLADACLFVLTHHDVPKRLNVGSGSEVTIAELARLVSDVVGFSGEISFDKSKPDGTPRKLLDSSRIASLGWSPRTALAEGLRSLYSWYRSRVVAP